jgi:hypothetical protein
MGNPRNTPGLVKYFQEVLLRESNYSGKHEFLDIVVADDHFGGNEVGMVTTKYHGPWRAREFVILLGGEETRGLRGTITIPEPERPMIYVRVAPRIRIERGSTIKYREIAGNPHSRKDTQKGVELRLDGNERGQADVEVDAGDAGTLVVVHKGRVTIDRNNRHQNWGPRKTLELVRRKEPNLLEHGRVALGKLSIPRASHEQARDFVSRALRYASILAVESEELGPPP